MDFCRRELLLQWVTILSIIDCPTSSFQSHVYKCSVIVIGFIVCILP